jgi:hypothetical protein
MRGTFLKPICSVATALYDGSPYGAGDGVAKSAPPCKSNRASMAMRLSAPNMRAWRKSPSGSMKRNAISSAVPVHFGSRGLPLSGPRPPFGRFGPVSATPAPVDFPFRRLAAAPAARNWSRRWRWVTTTEASRQSCPDSSRSGSNRSCRRARARDPANKS